MLVYSLLLTLGLVLSSPWWLLRMATTQRYREGLWQRLGAIPAGLLQLGTSRRIVWVHAVSVGEVLAATRLVAELESALGPAWTIVVSTTTRTGQALARERFGAPRVFYMPLDFAFAVRAYLNALQPAALILMESELWPRTLHECATRNIPVAVVNARVSDRSYSRALRVKRLWSPVLRKVTLWLTQSDEDARRLVAMGATAPTVHSVGNLKYDVRAPGVNRVAQLISEAAEQRPIVVAGSTVASTERGTDSEEAQVLQAWMNGALPRNALLVLAPRHPERFDQVWEIAFDFPSLRATDLLAGKKRENAVGRSYPDGNSLATLDILLLDTIGDLAAVYGVADIAYVGGSMMERGGHNPLEPAQFGVPILMGSSYENFRDIVEKMKAANAIRIVSDELELALAFEELLSHRDVAEAMGERGRKVFEQQQGATARTVAAILSILPGATP
jgi:3-deoxy-D-manno-octulosonic-acid transferase